jgi:predicted MFS family arabinose efflux permease
VQVWGWRSTFICLTVAAGVIVLPMLMLVVPETLQVSPLSQHIQQHVFTLAVLSKQRHCPSFACEEKLPKFK